MNRLSADPGDYQETDTDEARILRGVAVPCRLCEPAF
jgi:hypothetical protein